MSSKSSSLVSPSKTKLDAEEETGNVVTPAGDENEPSTSQGQVRDQEESGTGTCTDTDTDTLKVQQLNGPVMRIKRELSEITQNPPPNCSAEIYKDDLFHWRATVNGPIGTVYEDGIFKLDIRFPIAYPFRPPHIRFVTRIYHCNVDSRGIICLDVLNERWSPVLNIAKILLSIWVLIGECNPNDPLVMGIAEQYKCNRKEHDKIARYWTKKFAVTKPKDDEKQQQQAEVPQQQEEVPQHQEEVQQEQPSPSSSTENPYQI